jgi:uncharacterized tellurite resistance protein B-like protein
MSNRQQALLYLTYLLVYSDGEFDEHERHAISYICQREGISDDEYQNFLINCLEMAEREIFEKGLEFVEACSEDEKSAVFIWLYKLSEADGMVHAKEVRFLLYSLRRASINFDRIKEAAKNLPRIPPE